MTPQPSARAGGPPPAWYRVGPVVALAGGTAVEAPPAGADEASTSTADVYLYDVIGGWWGLTAENFVRDVASLDVDQLVLHINSPGGDVFEGVAIANVLRAHRARIVVRVDGLAASAASLIAMAGDEVIMGIGSQMMVHDASTLAYGNAADLEGLVRRLNATSDAMASAYAGRAGGTAAQWRGVMRAETWYAPEEAVTAGLANRVAAADETGTAEGEQITPGSSAGVWDMWDSLADPNRFDLSAFAYAGREHAPDPVMPGTQTPAASAVGGRTTIHEEVSGSVDFTAEQLSTMRQGLGLDAEADETAIVAAIAARPELTAPALPPGVVTIEAETLTGLQAAAQLGRDAHERQQREDRERTVQAAIDDGRIAPARRQHWLTALAADEGAGETLASLERGLIPVTGPIGHGSATEAQAADPAAGDDYWFTGFAAPTSREG